MNEQIHPTLRVKIAGDEYPMEVCVDLRPYDRIIWHLETEATPDGAEVWAGSFYKTTEAEEEASLTIAVIAAEKERLIQRWEALRASIPYFETRDDHVVFRTQLYSGPDPDEGI